MRNINKVIYWIGIYAICDISSDFLEELMSGLWRRLHEWAKYESNPEKKKKRRSIDISAGKVGEPINRIGF